MTHVLILAGRELRENRNVLIAAAVLGIVPLLLPPLFPAVPAAEIRGAACLFCSVALLASIALLGSGAAIGGDLAAGRLGFYFALPLTGPSIWAGRLLGIVALGALAAPLAIGPTWLAGGGGMSGWSPATLAGIGALLFLLLLASGHHAGIAARSRSAWLLADVALLPVVGWAAWRAVNQAGALLPPDVVRDGLIAGGALLFASLVAGGAVAVTRGRTDPRRAHRVLSLTTWSGALGSVLAATGFLAWVMASRPDDLASVQLVVPAARGPWAFVAGPARAGAEVGFVLNVDDGRFVPAGYRTVLSPDGTRAAWLDLDPTTRSRIATVVTARLDVDPPAVRRSRLFLPLWARLWLSPDGSRLAAVEYDRTLILYDLDGERSLFSARLPEPSAAQPPGGWWGAWRDGLWVAPDRFQLRREASCPPGRDCPPPELLEADIASRTLRAPAEPHALLTAPASHVRGAYRRPLADGRLALLEARDGRGVLRILAAGGGEQAAIDLGPAARLRWGGEYSPGRAIVAVATNDPIVTAPGTSLLVDLASGAVVRREDHATPASWAAWWFGGSLPEPGSTATRLFLGPGATLERLDLATGERRRLIPSGH